MCGCETLAGEYRHRDTGVEAHIADKRPVKRQTQQSQVRCFTILYHVTSLCLRDD